MVKLVSVFMKSKLSLLLAIFFLIAVPRDNSYSISTAKQNTLSISSPSKKEINSYKERVKSLFGEKNIANKEFFLSHNNAEQYSKSFNNSSNFLNKRDDLAINLGDFIHLIYNRRSEVDYLDKVSAYMQKFPFLNSYVAIIESFIDVKVHTRKSIKHFLARNNNVGKTAKGKALSAWVNNSKGDLKNWWVNSAEVPISIERDLLQKKLITNSDLEKKIDNLLWRFKIDQAHKIATELLNDGGIKRRLIQRLRNISNSSHIKPSRNLDYFYYLRSLLKTDNRLAIDRILHISKGKSNLTRQYWPLVHMAVRDAMILKNFSAAYILLKRINPPLDKENAYDYYWLRGFNGIKARSNVDNIIDDFERAYSLSRSSNNITQSLFWLAQGYKEKINHIKKQKEGLYSQKNRNIFSAPTTKKGKSLLKQKYEKNSSVANSYREKNVNNDLSAIKFDKIIAETEEKRIKSLFQAAAYGMNFYSYCAFDQILKIIANDSEKMKELGKNKFYLYERHYKTWSDYKNRLFITSNSKKISHHISSKKNILKNSLQVDKEMEIQQVNSGFSATLPIFSVIKKDKFTSQIPDNQIADAVFAMQLFWSAGHYGEAERVLIWLLNFNIAEEKIGIISQYLLKNRSYSLLVKMSNRLQSAGRGFIPASFLQPYKIPKTAKMPHDLYNSIIRQESEFSSASISKVGAIGPMQVRAEFAKNSRDILLEYHNQSDVAKSLAYGVDFFDSIVERFASITGAIAGYNAGPTRVVRVDKRVWVNAMADVDNLEQFIILVEIFPYRETRDYMKRILANYLTYDMLYNPRGGSFFRILPKSSDEIYNKIRGR